jgi:hypothetical protein
MKGKGIPVNGIRPVITAALMKAWKIIQQVVPAANMAPNPSEAWEAIWKPR